jgi:mitochondrial chaperone BCS1
MATVVLDNGQKSKILIDMNKFLRPETAQWYSNRGIPYKRGYLFTG